MSDVTIISNGVPREIVEAWALPADVRKEFDYVDWDAVERGEESRSFVRYKGEWYDLDDTEGSFPADRRWFYVSNSFFSGVLFRYAPAENAYDVDTGSIICGRYVY